MESHASFPLAADPAEVRDFAEPVLLVCALNVALECVCTAEDGRGGAHWRINSVVDSTLPAKMGILREQRNIRLSGTNDD